ncbi:MAG TPA: helix-turn-helix domain-containing protein [Chloroflexota bacterium]|nr:helix-turn-helix domain-containing protein [Chloroflexota bacterium]
MKSADRSLDVLDLLAARAGGAAFTEVVEQLGLLS